MQHSVGRPGIYIGGHLLRVDRLQSPPVDGRVREPVWLEEVLDVRDSGLMQGPDDVPRAGGTADYCVRRVVRAEGTGGKLFAQHG